MNVNLDVLELIFAHLEGTDLVSSSLVSRSFLAGVIPSLYARIEYTSKHAKQSAELMSPFATLCTHKHLSVHVKHIAVHSAPALQSSSSQVNPGFLKDLSQAIGEAGNLRSFTCTVKILPPLLPQLKDRTRLQHLRVSAPLGTRQVNVLQEVKGLQSLCLDFPSWNVIDVLPKWLGGMHKTLAHLTIFMSHDIDGSVLNNTLAQLPRLRGLHVIGCPRITHTAVLRALSQTPDLRELSFTIFPTQETTPPLLTHPTPALTHLSLDIRTSHPGVQPLIARLITLLSPRDALAVCGAWIGEIKGESEGGDGLGTAGDAGGGGGGFGPFGPAFHGHFHVNVNGHVHPHPHAHGQGQGQGNAPPPPLPFPLVPAGANPNPNPNPNAPPANPFFNPPPNAPNNAPPNGAPAPAPGPNANNLPPFNPFNPLGFAFQIPIGNPNPNAINGNNLPHHPLNPFPPPNNLNANNPNANPNANPNGNADEPPPPLAPALPPTLRTLHLPQLSPTALRDIVERCEGLEVLGLAMGGGFSTPSPLPSGTGTGRRGGRGSVGVGRLGGSGGIGGIGNTAATSTKQEIRTLGSILSNAKGLRELVIDTAGSASGMYSDSSSSAGVDGAGGGAGAGGAGGQGAGGRTARGMAVGPRGGTLLTPTAVRALMREAPILRRIVGEGRVWESTSPSGPRTSPASFPTPTPVALTLTKSRPGPGSGANHAHGPPGFGGGGGGGYDQVEGGNGHWFWVDEDDEDDGSVGDGVGSMDRIRGAEH
ncbi:hypothetical protein HYDPIDRAFT_40977 [Hydnomerulius pinastri MD-312]|uniref:F-box domain-containing protein n=1 Tax=Hydnomerulius pinastri MD-312 TaxID=994086 RepID=A0A0C9WEQ8_9AGAM|nr:hypothetical protein HYDPIDRAFT_40977 [Hydnomerulius pinastri MD-312]